MSEEEVKEKYDRLKLCRTLAVGFLLTSLIVTIWTYYKFQLPNHLNWIMPWGFLGVCILEMILTNTICRENKDK